MEARPDEVSEQGDAAAVEKIDGRTLRAQPTCGDFGGQRFDHRQRIYVPCTQMAGWGIPGANLTGLCKDHTPEALAEKERRKQQFLDIFEKQPCTKSMAAAEVGVSLMAIHKWRVEDPVFDEAIDYIIAHMKQVRLELVHDAAFLRMADPSVKADALRARYLEVYDPEWRAARVARARVEVTGEGGGPVQHMHAVAAVAWDLGGGRTLEFNRQTPPPERALPSGEEVAVVEAPPEESAEAPADPAPEESA